MQKTHELFGMIHHLKSSMGFKVGDTQSRWLNYISFFFFYFLEREERAQLSRWEPSLTFVWMLFRVYTLTRKRQKFCSSLKEVWFLMTVLYSIVLKDRHFNKIYVCEILFICVQLSNVLHTHLWVGELLRLEFNYFID